MDLEQVFAFTRDLYGADFKDIRGSLALQSRHLKGGVEDRPEQSSVKAAQTQLHHRQDLEAVVPATSVKSLR
jgi:hypothetical protein